MKVDEQDSQVPISNSALDHLMPMHVLISEAGNVQHVGPSMRKLIGQKGAVGMRALELFEISRPRSINSMSELRNTAGAKLHLKLRGDNGISLKGILVNLPNCSGCLLDLSFGISVIEAVRQFELTSADFAPTDLAVEMLYLVEAKAAIMEESRRLNDRLHGARLMAEEQAFTDTLTGLRNRRALDHVLKRLTECQAEFAVMQLDLDFFKKVNDTLGHAAGDFVLGIAANILISETRPEDLVARAGGDEFVLIFDKLTDAAKLFEIGNRIIGRLEEPIEFEGKACRISGSIGVTICTKHRGIGADDLLAEADAALYASKNAGRSQTTIAAEF